jgi:hypothetical protein
MEKRIVLLGSTGLNKHEIAAKLRALGESKKVQVEFKELEDIIGNQQHYSNWNDYLTTDIYRQAAVWTAGWKQYLKQPIKLDEGRNMLVAHGSLIDSSFGVRPGLNVNQIARDFAPDMVVTLIDNVFQMWWETESRADRNEQIARPTLEQLIMARRVETLIGDQLVVSNEEGEKRIPHYLVSINHPTQTFENLLLRSASLVYLSFPISAPRRLMQTDKTSAEGKRLYKEINRFHSLAAELQEENDDLAFVSPLTIDELPLVAAIDNGLRQGIERINFDPDTLCWPLNELWADRELITESRAKPKPIAIDLAADVRSLIGTDVGWRDSRLTTQASALAIFSPAIPKGDGTSRLARGVKTEIELATRHSIHCFVYQDASFDPSGAWPTWLGTEKGTMGYDLLNKNITQVESMEELFEQISKSLKP